MIGEIAQAVPPEGMQLNIILPVIITALATLGVGIYTARSARAANKETSQIAGWRDQVASWRTDAETLRKQRTDDLAQFARDREDDRRRFEREREEDRRLSAMEVAQCHARIDELVASHQRERAAMITWARQVVQIMRQHGIGFPAPPPGVADTDPGGLRPVPG